MIISFYKPGVPFELLTREQFMKLKVGNKIKMRKSGTVRTILEANGKGSIVLARLRPRDGTTTYSSGDRKMFILP